MTLDIRGSLKNTKISSRKYTVIEELISNSIDAFLIRRHQNKPDADLKDASLKIEITIRLSALDLIEKEFDLTITCSDNGCGLGDEQTSAFLTRDTSYKDDLSIAGIGHCKGSGRLQFFHHFSCISIISVYQDGDQLMQRTLPAIDGPRKIDFGDFTVLKSTEASVGTVIELGKLTDIARKDVYNSDSLVEIFSAENIKRQMLMTFLLRLVTLQKELADFEISFQTIYPGKDPQKRSLKRTDLPSVSSSRNVQVEERDPRRGDSLGRSIDFWISHYKLDAEIYDLEKNAISLCAKSSPVQDITARYLRTRTEQNSPVEGYYHVILIESELLDRCVNDQRDGFVGIPKEIPAQDLFQSETISYGAIYEEIDPIIGELVTPQSWSKEEVLKDVAERFGISSQMVTDTETRVKIGDNAKSVAERVLKKYQERIVTDTAEIFDLKEQITNAEPDSPDFRSKINELSWKYTSSLKAVDMANLSQLVVRRAAILEILALACDRKLRSQNSDGRGKNEKIIHSIFFPTRKDSLDVFDHDIWLLSEEYQYYDYIASDKPLSQIKWTGGAKLFDSNIDEEFENILRTRTEDNKAMRPDIAIFSKEGSAIIVEFKAPGVSMDDHIGDLSEYSHLLAAKSNGRLKRFYGYLIGDTLNPLRLTSWTKFATGKGYFQSSRLSDHENQRVLGELYSEILFFEDIVDRARKRIGIYKERLQVDLARV